MATPSWEVSQVTSACWPSLTTGLAHAHKRKRRPPPDGRSWRPCSFGDPPPSSVPSPTSPLPSPSPRPDPEQGQSGEGLRPAQDPHREEGPKATRSWEWWGC